MNPPKQLNIDSLEWFPYEVRAATLRLIAGGTSDDITALVDETLHHPQLRDIVTCLALFSYGAIREQHGRSSPLTAETLSLELGLAADLATGAVPPAWLHAEGDPKP